MPIQIWPYSSSEKSIPGLYQLPPCLKNWPAKCGPQNVARKMWPDGLNNYCPLKIAPITVS